jgi:hypothetical protein
VVLNIGTVYVVNIVLVTLRRFYSDMLSYPEYKMSVFNRDGCSFHAWSGNNAAL